MKLIDTFDDIQLAADSERPEIQRIVIERLAMNAVFQHPPSLFWWPGVLVGDAGKLFFSIAINPAVREKNHTKCEVKVWAAVGELQAATCIFSEVLDPIAGDQVFHWHPKQVDLAAYKDQFVQIGFQALGVEGDCAYSWLLWGEPEVAGVLTNDSQAEAMPASELMPAAKSPHIFLITNDAMRRDHLGCYGAEHLQTPNLDALATEGVLFENARSNSDSTLASHMNLLTGKSADVTGVFSEWGDFPSQLPNLATVLKGQGYQTTLISSELEFTCGEKSLALAFDRVIPCICNPAQTTSLSIARTIEALKKSDWSQPQFFWLHLFDPHPPAMPDQKYAERFYQGDPTDSVNRHLPERVKLIHAIESSLEFRFSIPLLESGRIPYGLMQRLEDVVRCYRRELHAGPDTSFHMESLFPNGYKQMSLPETMDWLAEQTSHLRSSYITPELIQFLKDFEELLHTSEESLLGWLNGVVDSRYPEAMYAANIEENDAHLGELFDYMRKMGIWEESCVLATAPHGECLCENELTFEHHSPVENVLRIPLLLKPPSKGRSYSGPVIETPFQMTDIASLLLEVCALQGGELLGGEFSLENLYQGDCTPSIEASNGAIISIGMQGGSFVIYRHPYKLLCVIGDALPWVNGDRIKVGNYLFDCSSKDGEVFDIAESHPEIVDELLECVDANALSRDLLQPALPGVARKIKIPLGEVSSNVSVTERPVSAPMSFVEDMSPETYSDVVFLQKLIRRAEKMLSTLTKERDYALRQVDQLKDAQGGLYLSKRWRVANVFRTLLKQDKQKYPPVDRIFGRIDDWRMNRLSEGVTSLWTRGGYVDQIKGLRSLESSKLSAGNFTEGKRPEFMVLIRHLFDDSDLVESVLYESLKQQSYPHWNCAQIGVGDDWTGDARWTHVMVLDSRDLLEPQALLGFAEWIDAQQDAAIYYADEDRLLGEDKWDDPFLKPDWSPDLMENMDAVGNAVVIGRETLKDDVHYQWLEEKRIYRLVLQLTYKNKMSPFHIRRILLHVFSVEGDNWRQRNAAEARRVAGELSEFAQQKGEGVWIEAKKEFGTVRMRRMISRRRKVCIMIPTRDRLDLLEPCISSLEQQTSYENYEILIMDNASSEPETLHYLKHCGHRVKRIEGKFNYAAIHNESVQEVNADWLIFLNNDIEVIDPDWIQAMAEYGQLPEIGAVGIRLLYPDGNIQHQGVVMGIQARASHAFAGCDQNNSNARSQMQATRNFSAVTAACMFTRRDVFLEMGGFEAKDFKIAYNDVDYCLRLWEKGYRVVCTPHSSLVHYESASRPNKEIPEEVAALQKKYLSDAEWRDPFYHPYLRQDFPNFIPDRIG